MAAQVKSKQRVEEHGEVFTNEREVNDMLDMVKQETERIDSRFLEPDAATATSCPRYCVASSPWSVNGMAGASLNTNGTCL